MSGSLANLASNVNVSGQVVLGGKKTPNIFDRLHPKSLSRTQQPFNNQTRGILILRSVNK